MAIRKAQLTMRGRSDILLHNGQTADPRNRYAKDMKAISSKRKKVDADFDAMSKIEWFAGLYLGRYQKDGVTYATTTIPAHVIEAAIIGGAKKSKNGPRVKSGVFVDQQAVLDFDGKPAGDLTEEQLQQALDGLYEAGEHHLTVGVRVTTNKVMRTRPKFSNWSAKTTIEFDDDQLNFGELQDIVDDAGRLVGVGDWRPKYGRFTPSLELVEEA